MRRRLPRRALLAAAALLAALAGGYLLLRDASAFSVDDVVVRGVSGPDAPRVEAALREAARDMTTLHVRTGALERAVAGFPIVEGIGVERDLPHRLTIVVHERLAVAVVDQGGRRVPLAADGRLLRGATAPDDLPTLALKAAPSDRVDDPQGRRLVALVAAAPRRLVRRAKRAFLGPRGLTLSMDRGPSLYFGTTDDLRGKWRAAARVLADPSAEGATYIDVRVPQRAAVGGLAPLVDPAADDPAAGTAAQETPATGVQSPSTGA